MLSLALGPHYLPALALYALLCAIVWAVREKGEE
jgi:hypothetical protein